MTRLSHLKRFGLLDAKVPRFTSFPPANWFSEAVGAENAAAWQGEISTGGELSLYVHIPFCRRLCWFCACRTQGTRSDAPLPPYVDRLLAEAALTKARMPDVTVRRLHLGGGTPTILSGPLLDRLLSGLDRIFGFSGMEEFSVEIDPTDVDRDRIKVLRDHGMVRASLGIQDFEPQVQEAIGRAQSRDLTARVVEDLRQVGVDRINFDLLYGLPHQSTQTLTDTLEAAVAMAPDRIALFGYAHVPWMSKRQVMIPSDALPAGEARFGLFETAQRRLRDAGYLQIGIDHFARAHDSLAQAHCEKRLRRNFQGYTDDRTETLLGLGASAISSYRQGFIQNLHVTGLYSAAVDEGRSAAWRGYALTPLDHLKAAFVEDLLCYFQASPGGVGVARADLVARLDRTVARYGEAVHWDGTRFALKGWAHPLVRIIAADFAANADADRDARRYSQAI